MNFNKYSPVSIVVIGKNESKNLHNTFSAIQKMDYPNDKIELIYVDTGSNDSSVEIAKKYTDKVFVEHSDWPTSGLARNRGLLESTNEIIHFIDGDIEIGINYLKKAVEKILQPGIDAVTGYFEEKYPEKFFNKLLNIRRDRIVHKERFCDATNGGGTYIKTKLLDVDGYDERILKGQETDLGLRYRKNGNKILFIDEVQGLHNFDINSIWEFAKSKFVYGKSKGFLLKLDSSSSEFIKNHNKRSINILLKSTFSLCFIMFSIVMNCLYLIPIYYFLKLSYLLLLNKLIYNKSRRELVYELFQYLFEFFVYLGMLCMFFLCGTKPRAKVSLK